MEVETFEGASGTLDLNLCKSCLPDPAVVGGSCACKYSSNTITKLSGDS